jgi:hypothetical protein
MFSPFIVKAWLSQGIVLDYGFGLTLDGILSSTKRKTLFTHGVGSLYDGGLDSLEPTEIELPLGKCCIAEHELDSVGKPVWHWQAGAGVPLDFSGQKISLAPPDQHRLFVKVDEKRISDTTIALPKEVGGSRGRFRNKVTPVLNVPAAYIEWRGVGNVEEVEKLLSNIDAVGARRGSGEGAVYRWEFEEKYDIENIDIFFHTNDDDSLNRPVPIACAQKVNAKKWHVGVGGLRPPLFHKTRQMELALPDLTSL